MPCRWESTTSVNNNVAWTRLPADLPTHVRIPDHSIDTNGSSPTV
jgi:hypothetical protein